MQEFFQCAFLKCGRYFVLVVNLMYDDVNCFVKRNVGE